jgi:hypothetical protein
VDLTIARLKLASMAGQSAPSADLNELLKQQQEYMTPQSAQAAEAVLNCFKRIISVRFLRHCLRRRRF